VQNDAIQRDFLLAFGKKYIQKRTEATITKADMNPDSKTPL
jgi:hypothetical protein